MAANVSLALSRVTLKLANTAWLRLLEFSFSNRKIASLTVIDDSILYLERMSSPLAILILSSRVIFLFFKLSVSR